MHDNDYNDPQSMTDAEYVQCFVLRWKCELNATMDQGCSTLVGVSALVGVGDEQDEQDKVQKTMRKGRRKRQFLEICGRWLFGLLGRHKRARDRQGTRGISACCTPRGVEPASVDCVYARCSGPEDCQLCLSYAYAYKPSARFGNLVATGGAKLCLDALDSLCPINF